MERRLYVFRVFFSRAAYVQFLKNAMSSTSLATLSGVSKMHGRISQSDFQLAVVPHGQQIPVGDEFPTPKNHASLPVDVVYCYNYRYFRNKNQVISEKNFF